MVALRYAGVFPEKIARLVVVEGTGPPMGAFPRPEPPERIRSWIESGRALAGRMPRRYASLEEAYQRMQEANPHLSPEQARHLTIHGSNENEDGTYSWKFDNYVHAGNAFDITQEETRELWRNIACPVLLITGSESWQSQGFGGNEPEDLTAAFGDARHEVLENAGHWPHHDQLDRFVGLVSDFLV
jgi:pimeloyl-ACP methyl ester carboxylesterase